MDRLKVTEVIYVDSRDIRNYGAGARAKGWGGTHAVKRKQSE